MLSSLILAAIVLICSLNIYFVTAECPNACSAHGRCGAYDMCICYRNWMANDCSERICQFGLAHVDTPLGDLDSSSGPLTGPGTTVATNDAVYPFGTQEQFPAMVDSDGVVVPNSAHYYRECSNKGICDRATGNCQCFDGYGGSACQRATCPTSSAGTCSGHGTCETISTIAEWDNGNIYNLWDEYSTMGCVCDAGYTGPDCSQRVCKVGPDPLYYDDFANVRISNYTIQFFVTTASKTITGNYSIIFYDSYGEDWETIPIDIDSTCPTIIAALEGLPNGVVPDNSVLCYRADATSSLAANFPGYVDNEVAYGTNSMYIKTRYTLAFTKNFGRLQQPDINIYLDGTRPTLYTNEAGSTLGWHVYPNGFIGEWDDLVPDLCEGVLVTLTSGTNYDKIATENTQQTKALKRCLGSADGNSDLDIADVYQWDKGTVQNPHLVRLIEATQESLALTTNDMKRDSALYDYPISRLCDKTGLYSEKADRQDGSVQTQGVQRYGDATTLLDGTGWCVNRNPAGFYAVLIFLNNEFQVFSRPSADYSATTKFHIFTTTGYLQLVNPNTAAFTHTFPKDAFNVNAFPKNAHSKVIYLGNNTASSDYFGQVDCETAPKGTYGSLDCVNKNDYVMILNTDLTCAVGAAGVCHSANPIYPNMYKVNKIYRKEKTWAANDFFNPNNEVARHQIVLDYGMNVKYVNTQGTGATYGNFVEASLYKFHPAPYNYVGECSNRGICDTTSGVCACFAGYTGDNCAYQNALAV